MATTDVFVIGGGPAGLAAAIAARQKGLDVTVADLATPSIDKACGEGIMPDGVAAARRLGIDLEQAAVYPFRGIRFLSGDSAVEADFPVGTGYGVRRVALHHLMVRCANAAGVRTIWGDRVKGLTPRGVETDTGVIHAKWIIGADGGNSQVRRWAGLDTGRERSRRFGFRRHYRLAPWSQHMELYWGEGFQLYVTPVSAGEICAVVLSRDPHLRLDDALPAFPQLVRRLRNAEPGSNELGAVTTLRSFRRVTSGNVALAGDASGTVDAITGEGMCLLFEQAMALADALAADDLNRYQAAHSGIGRRPRNMARLMLLLDRHRSIRQRALRAMASQPALFRRMLAMHVGELRLVDCAVNSLALGWRMLAC